MSFIGKLDLKSKSKISQQKVGLNSFWSYRTGRLLLLRKNHRRLTPVTKPVPILAAKMKVSAPMRKKICAGRS